MTDNDRKNMAPGGMDAFASVETLRLLYAQSPIAFVASLIAASLLTSMLWDVVNHTWLTAWLAVMVMFTLGRQLLVRKLQRMEASMKYVVSHHRTLVWLAFMAGTIWSAGSVIFLQQSPLEYQIFVILILGGMVVGASASYAASITVFNAFSLPALIPVIIWCLTQPDRVYITTGIILVVFTAAMWAIVIRNHAMVLRSLTHEHQSSRLARELQQEADQRKHHEELLNLQSQVLKTITAAKQGLESVLETLAFRVEEFCPGMVCSILLLNHKGKCLQHGAAPHLPEAWNKAVNGLEIGPCVGSCGTAAYRKKRVVVADIATDPLWAPYREMALHHGLRACWSQPVMDAEENVLGTFAMYYTGIRSPSDHEIQVIESAANLAAIAIEHDRKEETLRQLVEVIPDAVMMHCQGKIVYANAAAAKLFGATVHSMLGMPILNFVHADMQSMVMKRMGKAVQLPMPPVEEKLQRLDGSVFDAEVTALPVKYQGRPAIEVIIHDLSVRKEAEAEARRLRVAVEHAPEGIFIANSEGKITYCNSAFARESGLEPDQMLGRYAAEFRGGDKDDIDYRKILSRLNRGESWEGEFTVPNAKGCKRTVIRKVAPVTEMGETHYHVGIDFDVTEKYAQQARLEHTQRLESLGVLAGGIAHDFNNILTAILGNASLARMKLERTSAVQEHLHKIEVSSRRAGNLCHQMLAYAGKGKRVAKPMNISTLVNDISAMLEVSLGKNVTLEKHLETSLPSIEADESQMEQVLMNLITNANEAMQGENGSITITTGVMQGDASYLKACLGTEGPQEGQYVFLEVSDNGCGMNVQTKTRMFDPFFTTKRTGRGLGMSALLGIVSQHHGALHLRSREGEGTTFRILFPKVEYHVDEVQHSEGPEINTRFSGVALVVDDEEIVRETASSLLKHMGFDVLVAEDGQAGVEAFQKNKDQITVVLLDMNMPRMNGKEACRKMHDMRPNIPIILASGYSETHLSDDFMKKKTAGFLHKPYSKTHLVQILHRAMNS
ncbi:MAG: PAS domain S-box protein [Mariprofundaceae bacterium]|nr:PAS domain S-box protein [Mariprofundaceae bacterium]